ncbi:MAG: hypothetical protein ACE5K7_01730 [Phycisphaerae bacterium]
MWRVVIVAAATTAIIAAVMRSEVGGVAAWAQGAAETQPAKRTETKQPAPEQVLEELLRERPTNAPIGPSIPGEPAGPRAAPVGSVAAEARSRPLLPDGQMIARRTGRLVREGQWWLFCFESDGKALQDPPMRLLPCRWLEHMEAASAGGTRSVRFIVTGRVTAYHGLNYLLPENVLIVHDLGNLK